MERAMSEQDEWLQVPTPVVGQGGNRGFRPAFVISVLLHAGLLLALVQLNQPGLIPLPAPAVQQSMTVDLVSGNPQQRRSVAEAAPPSPIAEGVAVPRGDPESATTAPSSSEEVAGTAPSIAPLDSADLQAMISSVIRNEKGKLLEDWLAECTRYRNRYQTQDCPQGTEARTARQEAIEINMEATFSTWVTGHDRNARISEELLDDMDSLRPLMETEGLLGTLAAERYYFKREQFYYLNGTGGGIQYGGEGILPVMAFTPTSFVLLGGLLSFDIKSGFRVLDAPDPGPAKSFNEAETVHRAPEPVFSATPELEVQTSVWPVARFRE
jgi:hypothetical protein